MIDALDECPEPARDARLLDFLEYLHGLQNGENVDLRVFVASREEPDIRSRMLKLATHSLNFGDAARHMKEIEDHISNQLFPQIPKPYWKWSDAAKERVRDVLVSRSNGM